MLTYTNTTKHKQHTT